MPKHDTPKSDAPLLDGTEDGSARDMIKRADRNIKMEKMRAYLDWMRRR